MNNLEQQYGPVSDAIFRVMFSFIFIVGGLGHWGQHDVMMARLVDSPWYDLVVAIGSPALFMHLSGIVFIIGGFALLFGFYTRLAVVALFVTLVPITFVIHIAPDHVGPLLKNVAILGGLIHFFVRGPGCYSLDLRNDRLTARINSAPGGANSK